MCSMVWTNRREKGTLSGNSDAQREISSKKVLKEEDINSKILEALDPEQSGVPRGGWTKREASLTIMQSKAYGCVSLR